MPILSIIGLILEAERGKLHVLRAEIMFVYYPIEEKA